MEGREIRCRVCGPVDVPSGVLTPERLRVFGEIHRALPSHLALEALSRELDEFVLLVA